VSMTDVAGKGLLALVLDTSQDAILLKKETKFEMDSDDVAGDTCVSLPSCAARMGSFPTVAPRAATDAPRG